MASKIFEQTGGTYTQVGDYMLPDLLPAEEEQEVNIGVWAMRHKRYLKQNQLFLRLVKQMAEREGVTEKLKADNQMAWVARMNDIRSRTTEVVNTDLIYT